VPNAAAVIGPVAGAAIGAVLLQWMLTIYILVTWFIFDKHQTAKSNQFKPQNQWTDQLANGIWSVVATGTITGRSTATGTANSPN
jgi:hypothetical protein